MNKIESNIYSIKTCWWLNQELSFKTSWIHYKNITSVFSFPKMELYKFIPIFEKKTFQKLEFRKWIFVEKEILKENFPILNSVKNWNFLISQKIMFIIHSKLILIRNLIKYFLGMKMRKIYENIYKLDCLYLYLNWIELAIELTQFNQI